MDGKLSEEQMKCLLAPWRFSIRTVGFEERLLTVLELFERFPLDITVTGGTPEVNSKLASAVCGHKDERCMKEEETDEETDEEEDDCEEDRRDDEKDDIKPLKNEKWKSSGKKRVRFESPEHIGWTVPDFDSLMSHSQIPNVRVRIVQGHPINNSIIKSNSRLYDSTLFDVLVVLTTEEHKEDHMWLKMELHDREKPFYLVKAEQLWDVVEEKPSGPCMTCAWERMKARNLEMQRRRREAFGEPVELTDRQSSESSSRDEAKLVEMKDIGGLLAKALPELQKKAFSQFFVAITKELRVPRLLADETQVVVSTALRFRKINQEDLHQISKLSQSKDLTDHPAKLQAILTALDYFRLDVGVLGETGCGASSLVNALIGLKNDEKHAAPTGVTETTIEAKEYLYPGFPNICLWDLPGLGKIGALDTQFTVTNITEVQQLASTLALYDVYVLVSPLRLRLGILQLLQQLSSVGKECYLVISMVDLIEEEFVLQVREWAENVLGRLGLQQNLFLVSALHPETLDFPKLKETLNKALPSYEKIAFAKYAAKQLDQDVFWKRPDSCKFM